MRGQLSYEFVAVWGVMIIFFSGLIVYANNLQAGLGNENGGAQAGALAGVVAEAISAGSCCEGARSVFTLPATLSSVGNYSLFVINGSVKVNWTGGDALAVYTAPRVVNGSGANVTFALSPGFRYEVLNQNRTVVVRRA
ncbi:MAG TPA: hypothetical protein VGQ00_03510 [Candidatus Norongarragalinales archaeon]|jgi:hypothetical protein|nr:hypothetical protein [Candidatus Norongarragalinales archaeon]